MKKQEYDDPVICAECMDTGSHVRLADGNHLTCRLMGNRPIYGSKPGWCPKKAGGRAVSLSSTQPVKTKTGG